MSWWYLPVALLDLYLLLSVGPWVILQAIQWILRQPGRSVAEEGARLSALVEARGVHINCWPHTPRLGRYYEPDSLALAGLTNLNRTLAEVEQIWPGLATYSPINCTPVDVLTFRCIDPMLRALVTWRETNRLRRLLEDGEQALGVLRQQQRIVEDIPDQVRGQLNEARAEASHLTALLEVEQEAGTLDLENWKSQIDGIIAQIEHSLDVLTGGLRGDTPRAVAEVDMALERIAPLLQDIDRMVKCTAEERARAQGLAERMASSMRLATERWAVLQDGGAHEPTIENGLAALRQHANRLTGLIQQRTPAAYHEMAMGVDAFDAEFQRLLADMDLLEEAMARGKEAVEGNVRLLAEVQATCEQLTRDNPLLEPDMSLALIEKATEMYTQAERQRVQGTLQGFKTAEDLARVAKSRLTDAQQMTNNFPEQAEKVQELLTALLAETLSDWRSRVLRTREQLSVYLVHWEGGLAGSVGEAIAQLDQVEVDLERVSPNVRYRRRFRQSELAEALGILIHARDAMAQAREMVDGLEAEAARLATLRQQFDRDLRGLEKEILPALGRMKGHMLDDLQRRLSRFQEKAQKEIAIYSQPAQVNYDYAVKEWLPAILREAENIQSEQARSVQEYQDSMKEVIRRIDRAWTQLARLNPQEGPGPEEKLKPLAADLDSWRAAIEREADNPPVLHDLLRAGAKLEERIDLARRQVIDGRRAWEGAERQFRRYDQSIQDTRRSIEDLLRDSLWSRLAWGNEMIQQTWEEALNLERSSRQAETLMEATNRLQQAVNVAQQTAQYYERDERQVASAVRRLNEEYRNYQAQARSAEREVEQLQQQGATDELHDLEDALRNASHTIDLAKGATTFEDALRHLRAAIGELTAR